MATTKTVYHPDATHYTNGTGEVRLYKNTGVIDLAIAQKRNGTWINDCFTLDRVNVEVLRDALNDYLPPAPPTPGGPVLTTTGIEVVKELLALADAVVAGDLTKIVELSARLATLKDKRKELATILK